MSTAICVLINTGLAAISASNAQAPAWQVVVVLVSLVSTTVFHVLNCHRLVRLREVGR